MSGSETRQFTQADRNHDGMIDRAEASKVRGMKFDEVDSNGDGKVDQTELNTWAAQKRK
jgi:Ca2+-binding EF-hand superfamily protein